MSFIFPARAEGPEVYYSTEANPRVGARDLETLKERARANRRRRARLCTHESPESLLHEMYIVHARDTYVRPHRHPGKAESITVIEGEVDIVEFTEQGYVARASRLTPPGAGEIFSLRMTLPVYHTLLIRSECLVFHEVTTGPFRRADCEFAPWSPPEEDEPAVREFLARVEAEVAVREKTTQLESDAAP